MKDIANTFQDIVTALKNLKKPVNLSKFSQEIIQIIDVANINVDYVFTLSYRNGSEDLCNYYVQMAFNIYVRCKVDGKKLEEISTNAKTYDQRSGEDKFLNELGVNIENLHLKLYHLEIMKFQFEMINNEEEFKKDAWIFGKIRKEIQEHASDQKENSKFKCIAKWILTTIGPSE